MNKHKLVSIIIPTYNEADNIGELIEKLHMVLKKARIDEEIIIIDDNSVDGTGEIVRKLEKKYNIKLKSRPSKMGVSSAIIDGFKMAKGSVYCVMDADFSHPPEILPALIKPIISGQFDISIGSRYVNGGSIENWPLIRRIISKVAIYFAKMITDISDPVSGFFALKSSVIEKVKLNSKGCKILLEIIARGNYSKIIEIPYIFRNRKKGKSKLAINTIFQYLLDISGLILAKNSRFRKFFTNLSE